jgi:hypothetical protein
MLGWLSKKLGDKASVDRSSTISFVPHRHRWNMGGVANEPAMQLMSDWWVTNRTETDVFVLRAELIFREGLRRTALNQMQPMDRGTAGAMNAIGLLFWIVPPIRREDEDFKARIVMIDNFNQRHDVGKVIFKSPKTRKFPD